MGRDNAPTTFQGFADLGYRRLVPIVPPDAEISPNSTLAKRPGARGKAVGVRNRDGLWHGFDWLPHEADTEDYRRWQAMGAGIGIKTGQGLIAIDADTIDEDHARTIRDIVEQHLGRLPVRIGRYPKALYLCAVSSPMRYTRVEFGTRNDKGALTERVEVLSDGRQFVAHGVHPGTKQPYYWTREVPAALELPVFDPQQIRTMLEELREHLPAALPLVTEGAATAVAQESLRGEPEKVRKAVGKIPNTSQHFATRESYRDFGYAIKAALPDDPDAAFEIFADWCARWQDGENDPDIVAADWRRMKPPFRRGAPWLYELAEEHSNGSFTRADAWFDPIEETDESPFAQAERREAEENKPEPVSIKWVDPDEWQSRARPERKFIIANMIPDGEVTLLTGAGGVGKTLLAQEAATCVALGKDFLGHRTAQCKTMLFLCEDSEDELQIRQEDINAFLGASMGELSPNMRIASRKYMDNLMGLWDRNASAMKRGAIWKALRDDAVAFGAKLLVVDTIADTFGGNENDRAQVRQFIQGALGRLAQEIGGAVLALGHPSRSGGAKDGDGTSGSTAWHATVRSRLYLQHVSKDGTGPFRRLENRKANYGPAGDVFTLRWTRGAFELVTAKTASAAGDGRRADHADPAGSADNPAADGGYEAGEGGEFSGLPSTAAAIDDGVLMAVAVLAGESAALSKTRNSPYYAPRVMHARFPDVLGLYPLADVEAGWHRALRAGRVVAGVVGAKQNRHPIQGYVLAAAPIPDSLGLLD